MSPGPIALRSKFLADKGLVNRPCRSQERSLQLSLSAPASFGIMTSKTFFPILQLDSPSTNWINTQFTTKELISIAISGFGP